MQPRGDTEEGPPRSEDKLARRNGETSVAGPRGSRVELLTVF